MKKILSLILLVVGLYSANAATYTVSNLSNTNTAVTSTRIILQELTLWTTNTTPTLIYLYDGYPRLTNDAWTNYTTYTTNQVTTYITETGVTNNFTNTVLVSVATTNGGVSLKSPVTALVVPGSSTANTAGPTITVKPTGGLIFGSFLTLSNNLVGVSGLITTSP